MHSNSPLTESGVEMDAPPRIGLGHVEPLAAGRSAVGAVEAAEELALAVRPPVAVGVRAASSVRLRPRRRWPASRSPAAGRSTVRHSGCRTRRARSSSGTYSRSRSAAAGGSLPTPKRECSTGVDREPLGQRPPQRHHRQGEARAESAWSSTPHPDASISSSSRARRLLPRRPSPASAGAWRVAGDEEHAPQAAAVAPRARRGPAGSGGASAAARESPGGQARIRRPGLTTRRHAHWAAPPVRGGPRSGDGVGHAQGDVVEVDDGRRKQGRVLAVDRARGKVRVEKVRMVQLARAQDSPGRVGGLRRHLERDVGRSATSHRRACACRPAASAKSGKPLRSE